MRERFVPMQFQTMALILAVTAAASISEGCARDEAPVGDGPELPRKTEHEAKPAVVEEAKPAAEAKPKLTRSAPLPLALRRALRGTMDGHAEDMEGLLWASLLLDYDDVQRFSSQLLERPSLARPPQRDLEVLNNYLPPRFFKLQDQLEVAAAKLRGAAIAKDDAAIASHYARLTETCVTCHAMYLRAPITDDK